MHIFSGFDQVQILYEQDHIHFPMFITYPTTMPAEQVTLGPYQIEVSRDTAIAEGSFPLIIVSHGTGGSPLVYRTLAIYLAKQGFIVCMPEHPFNNRNDNSRADTIENLTDRPRHITAALDYMFAESKWCSHIAEGRVGMIGHSLGAYTALAAAGAIPHTQHQIEYDPNTKITRSEEIQVKVDKRLQSLILMAPAAGWFLSPGALKKVKIPIFIYSGEHDNITPLFHADIIKSGVSDPSIVSHCVVENAGHFSFQSVFPESMYRSDFLPAQDPPGFDRSVFQERLQVEIANFFHRAL